jgi:UDP-N-acetylmuramate--alanine ligase
VLCADDVGANSLPVPSTAEILRYGASSPDARLVAGAVRLTPQGSVFDIVYDAEMLGQLALQVPGLHNVRNALAAVAVGIVTGATLDAMRPGLERFTGVERRFQRLGDAAGVTVIDDYAHHPTEIHATLDAARATYPRRRIVAAFQPHLYTRTRDLATEFGSALAAADVVFLTDIYPAREQPIAGVTADLIATAAAQAGRAVTWQGARAALVPELTRAVRAGDVVLTLGAGDITRTGPELLRALEGAGATPADPRITVPGTGSSA